MAKNGWPRKQASEHLHTTDSEQCKRCEETSYNEVMEIHEAQTVVHETHCSSKTNNGFHSMIQFILLKMIRILVTLTDKI